MSRKFETEHYLKTRHYIEFDQMNEQEKVGTIKTPKSLWLQKLKIFSIKRIKNKMKEMRSQIESL